MQLVGYEPAPSPALIIASDGRIEREPLYIGKQLAYGLGNRHCAGRIEGDRHIDCREEASPRCQRHDTTWICAKCRGTCLKDEMDCYVTHDLYLAAFAPATFKVGVTTSGRLSQRLTEQGADRGARIQQVPNGRVARSIEADIAESLPDRIDTATKIRGLTRSLDEAAWETLRRSHAAEPEIIPEYEIAIEDPPIQETLARGDVLGVKGRLLCLQWGESTYVTDMRELVGYQLSMESPSRAVQAGLGAFT